MMRCVTEIGRVDILHEISLLSQYQATPREGQMQELLRVIAYLKRKPKLTIYMNPEAPVIDYTLFTSDAETFK